jgi:hypothetical protein
VNAPVWYALSELKSRRSDFLGWKITYDHRLLRMLEACDGIGIYAVNGRGSYTGRTGMVSFLVAICLVNGSGLSGWFQFYSSSWNRR